MIRIKHAEETRADGSIVVSVLSDTKLPMRKLIQLELREKSLVGQAILEYFDGLEYEYQFLIDTSPDH